MSVRQDKEESNKTSEGCTDLIKISGQKRIAVSVRQIKPRFPTIRIKVKVSFQSQNFSAIYLIDFISASSNLYVP